MSPEGFSAGKPLEGSSRVAAPPCGVRALVPRGSSLSMSAAADLGDLDVALELLLHHIGVLAPLVLRVAQSKPGVVATPCGADSRRLCALFHGVSMACCRSRDPAQCGLRALFALPLVSHSGNQDKVDVLSGVVAPLVCIADALGRRKFSHPELVFRMPNMCHV